MKIKFTGFIFLIPFLFFLCACSQQEKVMQENWFFSPAWLHGTDNFVYLKQFLEYTQVSSANSWMSDSPTAEKHLVKTSISLCLFDYKNKMEQIIKTIEIPEGSFDTNSIPALYAFTDLNGDNEIMYGFTLKGGYSSGVHLFNVALKTDTLVAGGEEAIKGHHQATAIRDGLELYTGGGNYGFFGYQTIYLFDHNKKTVLALLHDPLSSEPPIIPPYPGGK